MGKGKGKLSSWYSFLPSGVILVEYKNLRCGRSSYFLRQLQLRLPVKSRKVAYSTLPSVQLPISNSISMIQQGFI
jgi:hypothetical protein